MIYTLLVIAFVVVFIATEVATYRREKRDIERDMAWAKKYLEAVERREGKQ